MFLSINFQIGDFYGDQGSFWIDFMLPIAMLILGFLLNIVYEWYKERKRLELIKIEFEIELNALRQPLIEQGNEFKLISENLLSNQIQEFGMANISNLEELIDKYNRFNSVDLVKIYDNRKLPKRKILISIYNLRQHISLIDKQIIKANSTLINTIEKVTSHRNSNRNLINNLFKLLETIVKQIQEESDFKKELITIMKDHSMVSSEFKMLFGEDSLIKPLEKLVSKHPHILFVQNINPFIFECQRNFKTISEELASSSEYFGFLSNSMAETNEAIQKIQSILDIEIVNE